MTTTNPFPFTGLTAGEVNVSRSRFGANKIEAEAKSPLWRSLKDAVTEPMFILLVTAAVIYFLLGELSDGWFMSGAIILVSAISIYQDNRSQNALNALKQFTQRHATVIRDNIVVHLLSEEIVVGDYVVVSEGELVPADGVVKQLNDFSVNESILTGESFSATKSIDPKENNRIYSGTLAESGQCVFEITAVGEQTKLGQLGKSIETIQKEKTPLQQQINRFVKWMALIGGIIFFIIWGVNYFQSRNILDSLLKGLTIAMSVLPEEIPVALATFMALGAWRLMKMGIIVKETSTVEALGAATVLCMDKTGTITENQMAIKKVYDFIPDKTATPAQWETKSVQHLISTAMWASESVPFDAMEKAIHRAYQHYAAENLHSDFQKIHEYPLSGKPPMMTHVFENSNGERIIAVRGAPEAVLQSSSLTEEQKTKVNACLRSFAEEGLRVLGVGSIDFKGNDFPETQQEFSINFLGLLGFYDPPKKNIADVFKQLYDAGITLKIITGDNPLTTAAIAKQTDFRGYENVITSTELLQLDGANFDHAVRKNNLFTRMFPDLKLKIIESLKRQGEIVGMTGDGVNDGPALKAATIGIAMGKRGSEIAKEASSLILTDDDFAKMVDAVEMGRKIYSNLKKAIQYIISIHIPIILTVALPLILGWIYPTIFTPVHVIFLELIMGPTCSIVYENEPLEANVMRRPPRKITSTFFNLRELAISIFQGLAITVGTLFIYRFSVSEGYGEETTRSMVFTTLIFANIFLTLVNRSFHFSVITTLQYRNGLMFGVLAATLVMLAMILYIPPFASFFKITSLDTTQIVVSVTTAFASVIWFEIYKWKKRKTVRLKQFT
ncbi:MAG TPA: cation-translocating P-type ATPase [Flavipsychrobacter sp.]|nr:cation-translocating P-type ATPase [Flavipsychrobacter sp.]